MRTKQCLCVLVLVGSAGAICAAGPPAPPAEPQDRAAWLPAWSPTTARTDPLALGAARHAARQTHPADEDGADEEPNLQAASPYGYRGVSSFFNVREAYASADPGEWTFDTGTGWSTRRGRHRDEVGLWQSLEFGLSEHLQVSAELTEPLGTGGHGAPETELELFSPCWDEGRVRPALGLYTDFRIPTGGGSSGADGRFGGILTKTLTPRLRAHAEGWVMTVHGAPGDEFAARALRGRGYPWSLGGSFDSRRRAFQWGVGPGIDYQITDSTLAVINYLNCASPEYGRPNSQMLEVGLIWKLSQTERTEQFLKLAVDAGLDGSGGTERLAARIEWEISWD